MATEFWDDLERLLAESQITIDRPKGQPHPRYPELIYSLDYGYLEGTTAGDGAGIDVWVGSKADKTLTGILCTVDTLKRDAEIKLLAGCSAQDVETVLHFNTRLMHYLYLPKPVGGFGTAARQHRRLPFDTVSERRTVRTPLNHRLLKGYENNMENIPASHQDLLTDEKKALVYLATLMPDGSPQVTPVWFNTDGEHILLNSVKGRVKDKNIRARPTIALCIADPGNPYRYLQIRGKVVEITMDGAEDHIDTLNLKYLGNRNYLNHHPDQPRVIYKVLVEKVDAH